MDHARRLRDLPDGARRDLLRLLESPSRVRADAIRQLHERGEAELVDALAELEADELIRLQVVDALRTFARREGRDEGP
jgi:HEAT repeat protein